MRILTDDGFQEFQGFVSRGTPEKLWKLRFDDGTEIKATSDHRFWTDGGWKRVDALHQDEPMSGRRLVHMSETVPVPVYDAVEITPSHAYYTEGLVSHNCNLIYVDEAAWIPNNVAEDFFTAIYPAISAGTTTKIIVTSTPKGYNYFWKLWNDALNGVNGFKPISVPYTEVPGRDQKWADEQLKVLGEVKFNQEVLCQFLGSSRTLIPGSVLATLSPELPRHSKDDLDIYREPQQGNTYFISVDVGKGVGGDYSTFTVIDITQTPYEQVAKYRSNTVSPLLYPNIIADVGKTYNNAYVLIELNVSEQVPYILRNELEYENILTTSRKNKRQELNAGFGGSDYQFGVTTDVFVKRTGCATLKELVGNQQLILHDSDTIAEANVFVESHGSYAAESGYHDDLMMNLVLFSWATNSSYFKDLTNTDARAVMYKTQMQRIADDLTPFGFVQTGQDDDEAPVRSDF